MLWLQRVLNTLTVTYVTEPEFKQRMDKDLRLETSGSILALEHHRLKGPEREQAQIQQRDPLQQIGPVA